MEGFDKSKNVTPDLKACDMENRQSNPKMRLVQNRPVKGKFSEFFN